MLFAVELADDVVEHLLGSWPVARLATVQADGWPQVVPVVFAWVRGYLWSPIDGKPKAWREPARVRNVRGDPRVSLLLDHYTDAWRELWWLRVDGEAHVVQPPDPERDPDAAPAVAALRRKYPQYRETAMFREPPTLLAIRPTRVLGWCASPEAVPTRGTSGAPPLRSRSD